MEPSFSLSRPGRIGTSLFGTLALALLLGTPLSAQETGTVQGQVVDADTERPMAGAQISIPETGQGVLANQQGRFLLLNVPAGDFTVQATMIGYERGEQVVSVQPGEVTTVDFRLGVTALAMDELVVTGVGQATARRELSTSVSVIGSDIIEGSPAQSLDQLLQGRVAGTTVNAVSAQPGTGSLINFRGVSSVFGPQTPVIYVDGVRVDNSQATALWTGGEQTSSLSDLLVADIERIEITRGGAASTLYGSDAATGVIQIFTKRGQPGAPRITARVEQGFDIPELKYIFDADMIYPDMVEAGDVPGDFLERNFFQTGHAQSYTVGLSGGTEDITYNVNSRLQQSDGVQPGNNSNVYNLRGGLQANLADGLRLSFSGGYTRQAFDRLFNGSAIADPLTAMEVGDAMFFSGTDNLQDALDIFLMPELTESVNRVQFSTGLQYTGSELLTFRSTVGVDHRNNHQRIFQPIGFTPGEVEGSLQRFNRDFTSVTLDAATTLNYPRDGDLTSRLTVGVQGFREDESWVFAQGTTFALPGSKDFGEAATITASENNSELFTGGIYIDEQVGLWQRLFVNLGVRFDASTSFGDDVTFDAYPKAGASYALLQEDFFRNLVGDFFQEFRIRGAYGETGKPPSPFARDKTFSAISFRGESAPRFDNPGNPDLRPEVTKTFETGFEVAFLNNRVGVDFNWFDARTVDAFFFVPEQPATGQGTQLRNVGEIQNRGIELDVNAQVINRRNLTWHVGATFQTVDNEVTDMGGAAPFFVEPQKHVTEGRQVGAWFVTTPIDTSGDGLYDDFEREYTGKSATPTRSGSFSTRLNLFEDLQLQALADWATGHQVFDFGSVWSTFNGIFRRELVEGVDFPVRHTAEGEEVGPFSQSAARSAFLYDGDWWKLREISARYAMPQSWTAALGVDRGSIYGSVRNVFVWSENDLIDPELSGLNPSSDGLALGGESSVTLSPPRSFRFGIELTF